MKKFGAFLAIWIAAFGVHAQQWNDISSPTPQAPRILVVNPSVQNPVIAADIPGYSLTTVQTATGPAQVVSLQNTTPILKSGAPDLPCISFSVIIPDNHQMKIQVDESQYIDYPNISIAPSKGNLLRTVDPLNVPYQYGTEYQQNRFWPEKLCDLGDPYILRDFRGQTVKLYPFRYNPVTRILRVYTHLKVSLVPDPGRKEINPMKRPKALTEIDKEFSHIYGAHFLNFNQNHKYTPLSEHGRMLIICYGNFLTAMQPFVNWKNDIGIPTDIVSVSTAGSTAAAIKTYVTNYYNTNGLTYLLLVGDAAQIPTFTASGGGSDNSYAYITGNDHYQEFFVGRFSAENETHVLTQVNRTIAYERNPTTTPGLFNKCTGIGSSEGGNGSGDDNETDWQHQRNMLNDLTAYTYTSRVELFDGSQGGADATGDPTAGMVSSVVNSGTGIITYTGHGSDNSFVTTGFSNSNVGTLTNTHMWPFIWSVACVNGNFTAGTCFAEAWLRQTSNSQPAGAVATFMSTINQSWDPPMEAQDEMVDILVESYSNNIKRTFGGLSVNGLFKMNDTYNDVAMTDTWTIFGDPSLMVRTDNPQPLTVSHPASVMLGETGLAVNCNTQGAFVCLTVNHQIIGTGTVNAGTATVSFSALTATDSITVTVTAYNKIPYIGKVAVLSILYPDDASVASVLQPQSTYNCSGLQVWPQVILRNMGNNTLSSCSITLVYDGNPSTQNWSGSLVSLGTDTVYFAPLTLITGQHNIRCFSSLPNGISDVHNGNDTVSRNITVLNNVVSGSFTTATTEFCQAPATVQFTNQSQNATSFLWDFGDGYTSTQENPDHVYTSLGVYTVSLTADAGVCGTSVQTQNNFITVGSAVPSVSGAQLCNAGQALLSASGTGTLKWYDAPSGGNLIATGTTYNTPILSSTTTYYVQNEVASPMQNVGEANDSTNGSSLGYEHYLVFDCFTPALLVSVEVNATGSKNRTIELRTSTGSVLFDTTLNIGSGKHRISLNWTVPAMNDLRLVGVGTPDLFRTNIASALNYPYLISGVISIKQSSASQNPTGYYYYFYDWEVQPLPCISARVPVVAHVHSSSPVANFTHSSSGLSVSFTDQSAGAASYLWNFGDGNTSLLQNPVHLYSVGGSYNVRLRITNGCGADSSDQQIAVIDAGISDTDENSSMLIVPNPAREDGAMVHFGKVLETGHVIIYDVVGNKLKISVFTKPCSQIHLNTSGLSAGIYYIVVESEGYLSTQKLLITQ